MLFEPNDGVFTIRIYTVIFFCSFSDNLHFHCCFALIFKQSTHKYHKKSIININRNNIGELPFKLSDAVFTMRVSAVFFVHSLLIFNFIVVWCLFFIFTILVLKNPHHVYYQKFTQYPSKKTSTNKRRVRKSFCILFTLLSYNIC